jgi:hypothetical protein
MPHGLTSATGTTSSSTGAAEHTGQRSQIRHTAGSSAGARPRSYSVIVDIISFSLKLLLLLLGFSLSLSKRSFHVGVAAI